MPKRTQSKRTEHTAAEEGTLPARETRVDAAHVIDKPPPELPAPATPPQEPATEPREMAEAAEAVLAARQLRLQADQLAEHLRSRQRFLDRREAELNARYAQLDNQARAASLVILDRQDELEPRLAAVKTQQDEVEHRLARLAAVEAALQRKQLDAQQQWANREEQLAALADRLDKQSAEQQAAKAEFLAEQQRRENDLQAEKQRIDVRREASLQLVRQLLAGVQRRRIAVESQAEQAASRRPSPAQQEDLVQRLQTLETRQQQLDKAESELARARTEIDRLREELLQQRDKDRESARAQRQQMALEHRHALAELEEKRQALKRRSEQIDQNWAALEQLRSDLGHMHRETLEIRLATEELWVQLAGTAPPAAITHSLGQIRSRLADHYRLVNADLAEKKKELQSLYDQLASRHEKLRRHKEELDRWSAARQEEIQQQARRLLDREQQLDRHETQFNDMARQWETERLEYQQEIRRLRLQLDAAEVAEAAL
jgi:hypothetical protein